MSPKALAVALAMVALLSFACDRGGERPFPLGDPPPTALRQDSLVVGFVGSISGPHSWRGQDAYEGADLGVQALNRTRSAAERPFELVQLDDKGSPDRAGELIEALTNQKRVVGVVYAGPPVALPRSERVLAGAGIPAIACYGDLYGAHALTSHVFQTAPSFLWEARRLASYLLGDRGYERVGALVSPSSEGETALRALDSALRDEGGAPARRAAYEADGTGVTRALRRLKKRRIEALVVQGEPFIFPKVSVALGAMSARYRSTSGARIASAPPPIRRRRQIRGWWKPQVAGFDLAVSVPGSRLPEGSVGADSYARGAHYLPVPSLRRFSSAFMNWWNEEPLGWEQRAYDSVQMIGWAVRKARRDEDLALVLERMRGVRFGGLDITLGPDDHTAVSETTVGLWVHPGEEAPVPERGRESFRALPWVPLARGFSIDGQATDVLPRDWKYLFRDPPPRGAPAPRFSRMRFGVRTSTSDPIN
jgi:ABC-type branched-subunit amino acid transport system substrate-binding protein